VFCVHCSLCVLKMKYQYLSRMMLPPWVMAVVRFYPDGSLDTLVQDLKGKTIDDLFKVFPAITSSLIYRHNNSEMSLGFNTIFVVFESWLTYEEANSSTLSKEIVALRRMYEAGGGRLKKTGKYYIEAPVLTFKEEMAVAHMDYSQYLFPGMAQVASMKSRKDEDLVKIRDSNGVSEEEARQMEECACMRDEYRVTTDARTLYRETLYRVEANKAFFEAAKKEILVDTDAAYTAMKKAEDEARWHRYNVVETRNTRENVEESTGGVSPYHRQCEAEAEAASVKAAAAEAAATEHHKMVYAAREASVERLRVLIAERAAAAHRLSLEQVSKETPEAMPPISDVPPACGGAGAPALVRTLGESDDLI
jgi:hypothetical protein